MSHRVYPIIIGVCEYCKHDIVARNSGDNKPTRRFCSKSCRRIHRNKTFVWTPELRAKLSKANLGRVHPFPSFETRKKLSIANSGENHWNWKGGISPLNNASRSCIEMKEWRRAVFTRDDFRCYDCGERGGELHADHIFPYALFPRIRFLIENGRTLCEQCHKQTNTYAGRIANYVLPYTV